MTFNDWDHIQYIISPDGCYLQALNGEDQWQWTNCRPAAARFAIGKACEMRNRAALWVQQSDKPVVIESWQ